MDFFSQQPTLYQVLQEGNSRREIKKGDAFHGSLQRVCTVDASSGQVGVVNNPPRTPFLFIDSVYVNFAGSLLCLFPGSSPAAWRLMNMNEGICIIRCGVIAAVKGCTVHPIDYQSSQPEDRTSLAQFDFTHVAFLVKMMRA